MTKTWPIGRAPHGAAQRFYAEQVLTFTGDECLIWPFSRNNYGYAEMRRGHSMHSVGRLVAADVFGPPLAESNDAAHSCGNGHLGCVNPKHLRWATRSENMLDCREHGTSPRGARNGLAKLTEESARAIRSLRGVKKQTVIADMFGISVSTVSAIQLGQLWGWLA